MLFTAEVPVETTHTESNKKEQVLKIAHGVITRVSVLFPPGCHGLVHCVLLHHEHQIAPSTEGMTMTGDGVPVAWDEYYESYHIPYELKIKGGGVGCDYDHTIVVKVAVLPRKAIIALAVVDAMKSAFGFLMPRRIFTRKELELLNL